MKAVMAVFAFLAIGVGPVCAQDADVRPDSTVGKNPAYLALAYASSDRVWLPQESSLGKPVSIAILDAKPPRTKGIPLRFDTSSVFYIYNDIRSPANHFTPSGWMGDYGDLELDDKNTEDPADGKTCLKIIYTGQERQRNGWAGIYWQQPENNWGHKRGGFDLQGMKRLTFWAKGAKGGEEIAEFKVGGIAGAMPDTGVARIGPVVLSDDWKLYSIDLNGVDLRKVSGGFAWAASHRENPEGLTFYLDEIRYEK